MIFVSQQMLNAAEVADNFPEWSCPELTEDYDGEVSVGCILGRNSMLSVSVGTKTSRLAWAAIVHGCSSHGVADITLDPFDDIFERLKP